MADAKRVTILNQRAGKIVLPPDADELKANPKAKPRTLLAGQAMTVSADEAAKLLRYPGVVDASTITEGVESAEVKRLKAELAASKAENARLKNGKGAPADEPAAGDDDKDSETDDVETDVLDAKKGVAVLLQDGTTGVIQSVNKRKKTAKVKRDDNGNVSEFSVADLKPKPAEPAA